MVLGAGGLFVLAPGALAGNSVVGAPPPAGEPASAGWVLGVMIGGLVLSVTLFVGLGLYRAKFPLPESAGEGLPTDVRARRLALLARDPILPAMLLVGFATIYVALILGSGSAAALVGIDTTLPLDLEDQALLMLGSYVGAAMAIVLVGTLASGVGAVLTNGLHPRRWWGATLRSVGWLGLVLPVLMVVGVVATRVDELVNGAPSEPIGHKTLALLVENAGASWAWWLMVANVTIGAPLIEEVLYRGCLQTCARRFLGAWGAIVTASVLFALVHIGSADLRTLPVLLTLSLVLGLVYERSGSLLACVLIHAMFNALNLALSAAAS
jgi:membrane protease YdiL (CAAX protease family)